MKNKEISFEERQIRRRNRKVNSIRLRQGIKQLSSNKLKLIVFLTYIIISLIGWFLFIYDPSDMKNIMRLLIYVLFWLMFGLFTFGILTWFGKPKKAQKVEDDIKDILNIKEDHKVPIYVAIQKRRDGIPTYKFYSPDYSEDKYNEKITDIEQKFGIKIIGKAEGYKGYIYFDFIPNNKIKLRGELKDDRI